jgi:hypothetical protein
VAFDQLPAEIDSVLNPKELQDDFTQWMRDEALFLGAKRLEDGSYAGVQRLMFTTAICIGVTPMTAFQRRYCFNDLGQCLHSYSEIKQLGDEPEGWIARRPKIEEDYLITYNDGPK